MTSKLDVSIATEGGIFRMVGYSCPTGMGSSAAVTMARGFGAS
jgi:hypothetical protein